MGGIFGKAVGVLAWESGCFLRWKGVIYKVFIFLLRNFT